MNAFTAAHPLLSTILIALGCWFMAGVLIAAVWAACFPAIRYVPQAPGRASDRRKVQ